MEFYAFAADSFLVTGFISAIAVVKNHELVCLMVFDA